MTTDDEPRIRRRAPEPEKPGLRSRTLHGIIVTLDELNQVESIIRDYVAASPSQDRDYLSDRREVAIEAGTAILPNVNLVRALKPEELSQLHITGKTNISFAMVGAYFNRGGDVDIIWDSGDEKSVVTANLIESLLRQRPARLTKRQMSILAITLSFAPLVLSLLYLYLLSVRLIPAWISMPLLIIQIALLIASSRVQKRVSKPTIRNRTMQELEDARRIPRAQLIAYVISILSIMVSIAVALTR
jgi:hypothetical protein